MRIQEVIRRPLITEKSTQLRDEKNGGVFGLPRSLVQSVDQQSSARDPEIGQARERLDAGDPGAAARLLKGVVARDPRSVAAWRGTIRATSRRSPPSPRPARPLMPISPTICRWVPRRA